MNIPLPHHVFADTIETFFEKYKEAAQAVISAGLQEGKFLKVTSISILPAKGPSAYELIFFTEVDEMALMQQQLGDITTRADQQLSRIECQKHEWGEGGICIHCGTPM